MFLYNMFWSLRNGKPAGHNPWGATTLEWQTPDTPPHHGNWGPNCRWSIAGPMTTAFRVRAGFYSAELSAGRHGRPRTTGAAIMNILRCSRQIAGASAWLVAVAAKLTAKPWCEAAATAISWLRFIASRPQRWCPGVFLSFITLAVRACSSRLSQAHGRARLDGRQPLRRVVV